MDERYGRGASLFQPPRRSQFKFFSEVAPLELDLAVRHIDQPARLAVRDPPGIEAVSSRNRFGYARP